MKKTREADFSDESKMVLSVMRMLAACNNCGFAAEEISTKSSLFLNIYESAEHYSKVYPRLIGSRANNLAAMDCVFQNAVARIGKTGRLVMDRPSDQTRPPREPFKPSISWGAKELLPIAKPMCKMALGSKVVEAEDAHGGATIVFADTNGSTPDGVEAVQSLLDAIGKSHGRQVLMSLD